MLHNKAYLLVFVIGVLGALEMLVKKFMLGSLEPLQLILLVSSLNFILVIMTVVLTGHFGKTYKEVSKILTWKTLIGLVSFSFFILSGAYSLSMLAKDESISLVIPLIAVSSTIFTFIGGVLVFKEKVRKQDVIALILMSIGIYLMGI